MLKNSILFTALFGTVVAVGSCSTSSSIVEECDGLANRVFARYSQIGPNLTNAKQVALEEESNRLLADGESKCGSDWKSQTLLEQARRIGLVAR